MLDFSRAWQLFYFGTVISFPFWFIELIAVLSAACPGFGAFFAKLCFPRGDLPMHFMAHHRGGAKSVPHYEHFILLGQWLNFKLFGITYLVGKISRSNSFFFRVHWLSELFMPSKTYQILYPQVTEVVREFLRDTVPTKVRSDLVTSGSPPSSFMGI